MMNFAKVATLVESLNSSVDKTLRPLKKTIYNQSCFDNNLQYHTFQTLVTSPYFRNLKA